MLKQTVETALNAQINLELSSAYIYLGMAADLEAANLPGAAAWMRAQAQEELGHGLKLFDYVVERGGRVALTAIATPKSGYGSMLEVFRAALAHEELVTASIHQLYDLAAKEQDYATQAMLQWFITEQVEEEANAGKIVAQLEMVGDHPGALFTLDFHLGRRGQA